MAIYQNKWLCSYETLLFNTPDGDLDVTQYALTEDGKGYYIRTNPKTEGQFNWVPLTHDVSGLTKVQIVPGAHAYYDEFLAAVGVTYLWSSGSQYAGFDPSQLPSGSVVRIPSTAAKYNPLRTTPNAPQPSRTEEVTVLPPPEPIPPKPAHSSIALDATSNSGLQTDVSSYSWSHICTGTDLLLAFGNSLQDNVDRTVSGVTYNAVAMTAVRTDVRTDTAYTHRSTAYYLIAPAAGTYTVAVTLSGITDYSVSGVVSYTGAKQSGQPDANNGANGSSTACSVDVTTVANNCWVFDVAITRGALTCGNTQRWNVNLYATRAGGGADTNGPKTPAGAQTMSWTSSLAGAWAISAFSIAPVPLLRYLCLGL